MTLTENFIAAVVPTVRADLFTYESLRTRLPSRLG